MAQVNPDYRKKWLVLAAVSMGIFLATIDGSIVNIALPTLQIDLNTDFATVQWVVLAYLLTVTTLLLGIGRLGDMLGKKVIFTAGFLVFLIGSALCGLSSSIYWLIGWRVFQAVGAAMVMALSTAITTEAFPPSERGKALGTTGLMVSLGIIAGPALGGLILDALSWHWIFFVNLPIGLVGIFMVWRFVPNFKPVGGERFDFQGAIVLCAGLIAFLTTLTMGQEVGFNQGIVWILGVVFIGLLAFFIRIERRSANPMIDLSLFLNRLLRINLITGFLSFTASTGLTLLLPFFLENVKQFDTRTAGLMMGIIPLMVGVIAPLAGSLSDRFGTRPMTAAGLAVLVGGYLAASTLTAQTGIAGIGLRFIPIGIGLGIFQSPNNSAVMGSAPRERLGIVSGMLAITRTLGQSTGISVLSTIWASRVLFHAGSTIQSDATQAAAGFQVAGLHDTVLFVVGIMIVALGLSIWGLVEERKAQRTMVYSR